MRNVSVYVFMCVCDTYLGLGEVALGLLHGRAQRLLLLPQRRQLVLA